MAKFFCERCHKESNFLPIHMVTKIAGVSRSTIYYWMDHAWVHWLALPSGRRVICEEYLCQPAKHPAASQP
jgi:predicted site-specific integrase-resolvase